MYYFFIPILFAFINSPSSQATDMEFYFSKRSQQIKSDTIIDVYYGLDKDLAAYSLGRIDKKTLLMSFHNYTKYIKKNSNLKVNLKKDLIVEAFDKVFNPNTQINPNLRAINRILEACGNAGDAAFANHILNTMEGVWNVKPDSYSVYFTLDACRNPGDIAYAWTILNDMEVRWGIKPNIYCVTNTIKACNGTGEAEYAVYLLENMEELWGIAPDIYCFNHTIEAFAKVGDYVNAHLILIEMQRLAIHPNIYSLNFAITAHINGNDYQGALELYKDLKNYWNIEPNFHTHQLLRLLP